MVKALLAVDAGPDDWLFHIDGDEALQVDRAALAGLPPEVSVVRAAAGGGQPQKWPWQGDALQADAEPDELALLHVLGVIDEPANGSYFHGHVEGKSGLRPQPGPVDHAARVHDVDQQQVAVDIRGGCGRLLHYESWSGEEFVRKWTSILDSGTKVSFRPGTRAHGRGAAHPARAGLARAEAPRLPDADLRAHHRGRLRDPARPRAARARSTRSRARTSPADFRVPERRPTP